MQGFISQDLINMTRWTVKVLKLSEEIIAHLYQI